MERRLPVRATVYICILYSNEPFYRRTGTRTYVVDLPCTWTWTRQPVEHVAQDNQECMYNVPR